MSNSSSPEWKDTTLGQFTTLQRGVDLPTQDRRQGAVPILGSFGITGWHNEAKVEGPGITVGRSGASFGTVSYSSENYWPLNTALYVKDFHGNDPKFAYYFLKSFPFKQYNSGSAQPSLNRNFVHPVSIRVPQLLEQKRIAVVLGALDDKIELNRKMNRTLEAMAQAIFKSWLVDFDGIPPEDLVDSELGPIPKGWDVARLGEVADLNYGKNLPKTKLLADGVPVYGAAGVMGYFSKAMFNEPVLLITCRGSFSGNIHETWEPAFVTNNSMTIVPFEHWMSRHYLREALLNSDRQSVVTGSAQPQITLAHLRTLKLLLPPPEVVGSFTKVAEPCWQKIAANSCESRTLAELRDTLLPKLISGEIRIPEAEKMVEEV